MQLIEYGDVRYFDTIREFPAEVHLDLVAIHVDLKNKELFTVDFTPLESHVRLPKKPARTQIEYMCLTAGNVYWLAVPKHVDGEIETRLLGINDLLELKKGLE